MAGASSLLGQNDIAAQELPKGVTEIPLSKVKWGLDRTVWKSRNATEASTQSGPYLNLVKWPPKKKILRIKHPDDRHGMVISGVH